jgi:hypothetical protein
MSTQLSWLYKGRRAATHDNEDEDQTERGAKRAKSVERETNDLDESNNQGRRAASPKWGSKSNGKGRGGNGAMGNYVRRRDKSNDRSSGAQRRGGGPNSDGQASGVRFREEEDEDHYNEAPRHPTGGGSSMANRMAALERRVGHVEKLAVETSLDSREAIAYVRQCFLGPSADPLVSNIKEAKAKYDQLDAAERGSPQPYRMMAALHTMQEDTEIDEDVRALIRPFLAKMEELDEPSQWERYITVCRTASTRDISVNKFHVQLSQKTAAEFPQLQDAVRQCMIARGWRAKDGTAPTSMSFKAVSKEVTKRREWS